ncbi:DNA-binding LacI/PurR family transcriptional regulator [Peribacillus deserti]|uniref:DNA-binding LacI/PurR family transcriptional regulator n=1 Tax=Peribacillus deserti TaxID=673318 RepID=A0ABS2QJW8_9BACI|nr:LacI family DNA-binding transcriptional regulator [Peribacillus deserti]MBM7693441.1 DNA-binding LacI/PurR family transcriptional regulator [Peribacillus deserti]
MAITIKDIAREAKVAPSTVSRVIADNPKITEKTKKKVRKVMEQMGYYPNFHARNLANRATKSIGIVMPISARKGNNTFQNPFFQDVIKGISSFAHSEDYSLYITTGETDEEIYSDVMKMVKGKRVDGIILLYSRESDPVLEFLTDNSFPFVLVGKPPEDVRKNITYVDNDNYAVSRELTQFLLSLGHERIAFIGGHEKLIVTKNRLAGFLDTLALSKISVPAEYVKHTDFIMDGGKKSISELLALKVPPTAIFVTDDVLALGILNALHEKGISVPDEMNVVSFNNLFFSEFTSPPLTTVEVNIYQLGYEAARSVVELIEERGNSPKCITVPTEIVVRKTTEPLMIKI